MENVLKGKLLDHDVNVWFTGMVDFETKEQSTWVEVSVQKPDGSFCHGRFEAKWLVPEMGHNNSTIYK